jgi:hypothetical protein
MRLFECDRCKAVNRIKEFRLDKQPICGVCGQELIDFPFCRIVRRARSAWGTIIFVLTIVGFGGVFALALPDASQRGQTASPAAVAPPPPALVRPPTPSPPAVYQSNAILDADRKSRVAPLSVRTPSGSGGYYVKLTDPSTGEPRLAFFVNAGSQFDTKAALGKYHIRFATGDRWLGCAYNCKKPIFWPRTHYFRLDSTFTFSSITKNDGIEYQGHALELIMQRDGNLSETEISEAEFGD